MEPVQSNKRPNSKRFVSFFSLIDAYLESVLTESFFEIDFVRGLISFVFLVSFLVCLGISIFNLKIMI